MAFTQTVLSVIAGFADSVSGQDILLFCTVALLFILTALVLMFFKNPQLLIAQNADLIPLALLEKFDSWEDPKLVQHVLNAIANKQESLVEQDDLVDDSPVTQSAASDDYLNALEALKELEKK